MDKIKELEDSVLELEKDFVEISKKLKAVLTQEQLVLLAEFQNKYRNFCEIRQRYYDELEKED